MSYIVTKTDGTTLTTIIDGTKDSTSTSLTLLGRNYSNYGQFIATDFVWLLENFSNETEPANPITGQIWWQRNTKVLNVYTGTGWKTISSATSSSSAPTTTTSGDMWWNTLDQQLYVYNGASPYSTSGWILIGPSYSIQNGQSGAIWENIVDTSSHNHHVISLYLDGVITGIISTDSTFTPNVSIPGFTTIQKGYNLRSSDYIWGTSYNSSYLGNQPPSKYLRNDIDNTTTGNIVVLNDNGITLGSSQQLKLNLTSNDAYIKNTALDGNIEIYVNALGVSTEALNINGLTGEVSVAADPTKNLGISTKQYVDNKFTNTSLYGNPVAPTQTAGDNTTKLATTAFVHAANLSMKGYIDGQISSTGSNVNLKANIASPTLTGVPKSVTMPAGTANTAIATTEYVDSAINDLSSNTDTGLSAKANIASPTFTGNPTAPTPTAGDNDSSIATTAFVHAANLSMKGYIDGQISSTSDNVNLKANIASPTLTGVPKSVTMPAGTANTSIATTEYVDSALSSLSGDTETGLSAKANIASPTLTGVPKSVTMPAGTANTAIATTAFVINNSGFLTNSIYQGNSNFTIVDAGTGSANLTVDGVNVLSASADGVFLRQGSTAYTWPQTTSNTTIATTSYVRTAVTKWDGSSKFVSNAAPDSGLGVNGDFWFQYQ